MLHGIPRDENQLISHHLSYRKPFLWYNIPQKERLFIWNTIV